MSAVQSLIGELVKRGISAEWEGTGGGCMAIAIYFGPAITEGIRTYEILITDREDVFTTRDYASDEDVFGFHAGFYAYDSVGERVVDDVVLFRTDPNAGDAVGCFDPEAGLKVVDLAPEIMACADAVQFAVQKVEEADAGRV